MNFSLSDLSEMQSFVLAAVAMVAGLYLLIRGGNWTIDSAVYVARAYGLPPLIVGFTIVAFGTSLPEMVVSLLANLQESGGIAVGNVLGSNIANILCVVGIGAMIAPMVVQSRRAMNRDLVMMLATSVLLLLLLSAGTISRAMGIGMLLLLVGYTYLQYHMARAGEASNPLEEEDFAEYSGQGQAFFFLLAGLIGVALGAQFLVFGAKSSAVMLGVPDAVIALSIIAFGTSVPELSTCIIAAKRGQSDIAFGNVIGSNVFNILMILGVTSIIKPIMQGSYAQQLVDFDMWVAMIVAVVFAFMLIVFRKVGRLSGVLFFGAYIVYNIYIYFVSLSGV